MNTQLIDKFENNNLQDIIYHIENDDSRFNFKLEKKYLPEFIFTSKNEILDGYYDFKVDKATFIDCFIYKKSIHTDNTFTYQSGSYNVIIEN